MAKVEEHRKVPSPRDTVSHTFADKFEVVKLIGSEEPGTWYLARDLAHRRQVTLFHARPRAVVADRQRVAATVEGAAKIEHANIVRLLDAGSLEDGSAFFATELVAGVPLRRLLARNGPFPITSVLAIVQQAAAGLRAGHERGLVHGAVTPDSLFVQTDTTGVLKLKVADFGVSSLLASAASLSGPREPETFGLPFYAAPEQFLGAVTDERTDVYALAVITYELLTGCPPFEGSFVELARKHRYTEPPRLATFGVWVPLPVEYVIMRALAKNRVDRIGSVEDFAREMDEALASRVAAARSFVPVRQDTPSGTTPPRSNGDDSHGASGERKDRSSVVGAVTERPWLSSRPISMARPRLSHKFVGRVREAWPPVSTKAWLALLLVPLLAFAGGVILGVRTTDAVKAQEPDRVPEARDQRVPSGALDRSEQRDSETGRRKSSTRRESVSSRPAASLTQPTGRLTGASASSPPLSSRP